MAEIIRGGGNPEKPKGPEHYGGSRYKSRRVIEEELPVHGQKVNARKAALEGGHHHKDSSFEGLAPFGYTGDRIGLINIKRLMLGDFFKRGKKRKHATR